MLFDEVHHLEKPYANTAKVEMREKGDCCYTIGLYRGRKISYRKSNSTETAFDLFEKPVFTSSFNHPLFPISMRYNLSTERGPV